MGIVFAKSIKEKDEKLKHLDIFFEHEFKLVNKEGQKRILSVYRAFEQDKQFLFTHLKHPKLHIPTTTNLLESMNGHLEDRLTGIRGFESRETADRYLNALILKRRFKLFKSCRFPFTHLNNRSSLEIVNAKNILKIKHDWVRYCLRNKDFLKNI